MATAQKSYPPSHLCQFTEKTIPSPTIQQECFVFEVLGRYINNAKFQDKILKQTESILVINQTAHTLPQ